DEGADNCSGHSSNVPPTQRIACGRLAETSTGQGRHKQENSDVVHQQAEEEGAEQAERVATELRNEQITHGGAGFLDVPCSCLDEIRVRRSVVPKPAEQGDQLRPSLAAAGKITGRLGQNLKQENCKRDRYDAAQNKQRPPSINGKNPCRKKCSERAA